MPNVGKSTLFQTITKKQVDCANYPFCTIDPNVGVVAVPDERVDKLSELTHSAKKIYTAIEFVDIAGLVKGAAAGEGLGNKFLANIRETDAIVYVLRAFKNEKIVNTLGKVDPVAEKEILEAELILKDLETLEKRIGGLGRDAKAGKKEAIGEMDVLNKAAEFLKQGRPLIGESWSDNERKILHNYQFLTMKPALCLLNGREEEIAPETLAQFQKNNLAFLVVDVATELEAGDFSPEERAEFGLLRESGINTLIKKSYELLDLITFLTTGPDETHAWTIRKGEKAPAAGGVIHSDFEKNFIRAEAINWQDLLNAGGFAGAREKGLIRTEGKDYVVRDGDVIEIKHGA